MQPIASEFLLALDPGALVAFLERRGYRVLLAEDDGWECLLRSDDERWAGAGPSEIAALVAALARALPSRLATGLVQEAWAIDQREASGAARAEASAAGADLPPPDAPKADDAPKVPSHPAPEPTSAPVEQQVGPLAGGGRATSPADALDQLAEVTAAVFAQRDEVALWSPDRQRLQVLAWIAAGRSIQEEVSDERVEHDVARLARELGRLCAIWWPGSVPALQIAADPGSCRALLGRDTGAGWGDVAEAALERLDELQREGDVAALDERGYADTAALTPGPEDPQAELDDIASTLVAWTWSLDRRARDDERERALPPASHVVALAHRVRWVRGSVEDGSRWGALIGRLRFLCERIGHVDRLAARPLEEALDPLTSPRSGWAKLLGRDPEARERQRRRKRLVKERPVPDDPRTPEALRAWIAEALACSEIELERLAGLARPVRELVLGFDPTELPDRAARRRLRRLEKVWEIGVVKDVGETAGEPSGDAERDVAAQPPPGTAEQMLADVLTHTRGRKALLVSNRADPDQDRMLEETFALRVEHEVASPRVLSALADRVRAGRYDLVLSVTGFQAHRTDAKLASAARDAGVPYVRVNRGRRLACIRALHRDLARGA